MHFRMTLPAAAFAAVAALTGTSPAQACGVDAYIGQICYFAGNFCPQGTYPATGGTYSNYQDQALLSLIGTLYGGSQSSSTFMVPNLAGRLGVGTSPTLTIATKRGQMTSNVNLIQHTHTATYNPAGGTTPLQINATVKASQSNGTHTDAAAGDLLAVANYNGAAWPHYAPATAAGTMVTLAGASAPITGSGTPTLAATGSDPTQLTALSIVPAELTLTACIVGYSGGVYPMRPN